MKTNSLKWILCTLVVLCCSMSYAQNSRLYTFHVIDHRTVPLKDVLVTMEPAQQPGWIFEFSNNRLTDANGNINLLVTVTLPQPASYVFKFTFTYTYQGLPYKTEHYMTFTASVDDDGGITLYPNPAGQVIGILIRTPAKSLQSVVLASFMNTVFSKK